ERAAAMDAIDAFYQSLPRPDAEDVNQQLLDFIRSRPEFEDSGTSSTANVWARFTDGRGLAILTWPLPQLVSAADATPDSFRPGVLSSGGVAASSQSLSRESQDLHQADALQADGFPGTRALLLADATQGSGITLNEANFIADKLKAAGGYSGVVGLLD